jgi:hypothetical protein
VIWIHDVSQTALAGAVLILGLVIMLELRSIVRLRRLVDGHLARVFEQLDLLRFENQQLLDARPPLPADTGRSRAAGRGTQSAPTAPRAAAAAALPAAARPKPLFELTPPAPLASGEARLLASLAAARARRDVPETAASRSSPGR